MVSDVSEPQAPAVTISPQLAERGARATGADVVFDISDGGASYDGHPAVADVSMRIYRNRVTAVIGPSGCGKSTFIRCFNRMNDLIEGAAVQGRFLYHGEDMYGPSVDPVEVRKRIGMVFQKPNPFPKSIYDNVAFGARVLGMKQELDARVEDALTRAALWGEVKDRLRKNALSLSGGQQQRLCIARALAVEPEALLLDEPASALDPTATAKIEELLLSIKESVTIAIVTHNMQQAARISDRTAFLMSGRMIETGSTQLLFTQPRGRLTEDYITGRFG